MYSLDISQIESTTPSAGASWSSDLDSSVSNTDDWIVWQSGKYLYAGNETQGIRFLEVGGSTVFGGTAIPKPLSNAAHKPVGLISQPYIDLAYTAASETASPDPVWTTTTAADKVTLTSTVNQTSATTVIAFASGVSALDYRYTRYAYLLIRVSGGGSLKHSTGTDPVIVRTVDSLGTTKQPVQAEWVVSAPFGDANNHILLRLDMWKSGMWLANPAEVYSFEVELTTSAPVGATITLSPIVLGGCELWEIAEGNDAEYIEAAWCYAKRPTLTSVERGPLTNPASYKVEHLKGRIPYEAEIPTGSLLHPGRAILDVQVIFPTSLPTGISSSDRIEVYIKSRESWIQIYDHLISDIDITTYDANNYVWTDRLLFPIGVYERYAREGFYEYYDGRNAAERFVSASKQFPNVTCGVHWRRHNIIARTNGLVHFSRANNSGEFWSDGYTPSEIDPNDLARPRTVEVSDKKNPVLSMVAQDAVYFFTRKEALAMTSPGFASQATAPRKIPRAGGVLGKRAACAFRSGAVYATDRGLYYVEVPSGFNSNDAFAYEELTRDNRAQWRTLLGSTESDWAKTIVAVHDDEIWVVCRTRYMRLTKMGNWIYGTLTDAMKHLVSDQTRGLMGQTETGKLVVFGDYTTDDGTTTAGDAGTAVTWSWRSKRFTDAVSLMRAILNYEYTTAATITVKGYTERESTPSSLSFTGTNLWEAFPFVTDPSNGSWFEIEIAGGATDRVVSCVIEAAPAHEGGVT